MQNQTYDPLVGTSSSNVQPPVWQEFEAQDGRKYYFNKATQQTQWEKPDELKTDQEKKTITCDWKEYVSEEGRKYYHNSKTGKSEWEMPEEYRLYMQYQTASQSNTMDNVSQLLDSVKKENEGLLSNQQQIVAPSTTQKQRLFPGEDPQSAKSTFWSLLRDEGVGSEWSWEKTMSVIIDKQRYQALKSLIEKKQAFFEYSELKKKEEEEDRRMKKQKIKDDFATLLKEKLEEGAFKTNSTSYKKVFPLIENDPRYLAVVSSRERMFLFEEFLFEVENDRREKEREDRKMNMEKLYDLFKKDSSINYASEWRKVKEAYQDEECFKELAQIDALAVFEDRMKEIDAEHTELRRAEREAEKARWRTNRDAFRTLLQEKYDAGEFHVKTKWKQFVKAILVHPSLTAMLGQPGSTPAELYYDFCEDLEEKYQPKRKIIKSAIKEAGIEYSSSLSLEDYNKKVASIGALAKVDPRFIRAFYDEFIEKGERKEKHEKRKEKEKERKRRKAAAKLSRLFLHSLPSSPPFPSYADLREEVSKHSAFKRIEDEERRKEIFEEAIKKKQENDKSSLSESSSDNDDEEEEGLIKEKKKKEKDSTTKKHKSSRKRKREIESSSSSSSKDSRKRRAL